VPASTRGRCAPAAMAFSHVQLPNILWFACTDSGCVGATQARELRGLLAWGYFVSGCDDTRAYLWSLAGTANPTAVCVCRHGKETASPVGYERHLSQFRKAILSLFRGGMAGASGGGRGVGSRPCRCVTTPGSRRAMLSLSHRGHRLRAPGTSRVLVL
jgi:hypothetical protein